MAGKWLVTESGPCGPSEAVGAGGGRVPNHRKQNQQKSRLIIDGKQENNEKQLIRYVAKLFGLH